MATEKMKIFIEAQDKASREINKVQKAFREGGISAKNAAKQIAVANKALRDTKTASGAATSGISKFISGIAMGNLAAMAITAGLREVKDALVGTIEAAANTEKQWGLVTSALERHGLASKNNIATVRQFADEMQTLTGVADEDYGRAVGRMVDAGQDLDTSFRAVTAAADIAANTGKDTAKIMNQLSDAIIKGDVVALEKWTGEIDTSLPFAEQLNIALERIEKNFGGAAAANAGTYAVRIVALSQKFSDLQEKIGKFVLPILLEFTNAAIGAIDIIIEMFGEPEDKLSGKIETVAEKTERLAENAKEAAVSIAGILVIAWNAAIVVGGAIKLVFEAVADDIVWLVSKSMHVMSWLKVKGLGILNSHSKAYKEAVADAEYWAKASSIASNTMKKNLLANSKPVVESIDQIINAIGNAQKAQDELAKKPKLTPDKKDPNAQKAAAAEAEAKRLAELEKKNAAAAAARLSKHLSVMAQLRAISFEGSISGLSKWAQEEARLIEGHNKETLKLTRQRTATQLELEKAKADGNIELVNTLQTELNEIDKAITALARTQFAKREALCAKAAAEAATRLSAHLSVMEQLQATSFEGSISGLSEWAQKEARLVEAHNKETLKLTSQKTATQLALEKAKADGNIELVNTLQTELNAIDKATTALKLTQLAERKELYDGYNADEIAEAKKVAAEKIAILTESLRAYFDMASTLENIFRDQTAMEREQLQERLDQNEMFGRQNREFSQKQADEREALSNRTFASEEARRAAERELDDVQFEEKLAYDRALAEARFEIEEEANQKTLGQRATMALDFVMKTSDQIEAIGKFNDQLKKSGDLQKGLTKVTGALGDAFGSVTQDMWDGIKASAVWITTQLNMIAVTIANAAVSAAKAVASIPIVGPGLAIAAGIAVAAGLGKLVGAFDDPENDAVARRWGKDAGHHFMKGFQEETGAPQFGNAVIGKMRGSSVMDIAEPTPANVIQHITINASGANAREIAEKIVELNQQNATSIVTTENKVYR